MESELRQKVSALADIEDIEGMTRLLCEWPDKTLEWLIYVDVRISAPSTTKEQKLLLKQVKAEALALQPELAEQGLEELIETAPNKQSTSQEAHQDFVFTDEDRENFEVVDTLEDFEPWDADEITDYITSLKYGKLNETLQYLVNQYAYGLMANGHKNKTLKRVTEQNSYQEWFKSYAPERVLTNYEFDVKDLMRLATLDNQVELISKKDYYAYLLERGDEDLGSFDDFLQEVGGLNNFTAVASTDQLEQFERKFGVKLPEELKDFYHRAGSLSGTASKPCGIFSVSELEYHLDPSRKRYEHLKSMGLISMLEFVWGNSKDDFSPARGSLTQDQVNYLNQHYSAIGYIPFDDNVNVVIYFDREQRFGAVWYNQDDGVVYDDYLYSLLKKSQAQFGLCQLLAVIPFVATNPLFEDEQEQCIADLASDKAVFAKIKLSTHS